MKLCLHCSKELKNQQKKYCCNSCAQKVNYLKTKKNRLKYAKERYTSFTNEQYQKSLETKRKSYHLTKDLSKFANKRALRRALQLKATPKWADLEEIKSVYLEAQYLQMEVDHIYPLQGKTVCGLHVWENLQIIPRNTNRAKLNHIPTEEYVNSLC